MFVAENPSTFGSKPSSVRRISTSTLSAPLVAMTLITHPIAFESDSPVGTDIIGTRKLFMMQKMHSSLRKESTDRQPLTTIVNIIVIQQNILCLNMALLIYRVVTSGSIAIPDEQLRVVSCELVDARSKFMEFSFGCLLLLVSSLTHC